MWIITFVFSRGIGTVAGQVRGQALVLEVPANATGMLEYWKVKKDDFPLLRAIVIDDEMRQYAANHTNVALTRSRERVSISGGNLICSKCLPQVHATNWPGHGQGCSNT